MLQLDRPYYSLKPEALIWERNNIFNFLRKSKQIVKYWYKTLSRLANVGNLFHKFVKTQSQEEF